MILVKATGAIQSRAVSHSLFVQFETPDYLQTAALSLYNSIWMLLYIYNSVPQRCDVLDYKKLSDTHIHKSGGEVYLSRRVVL